MEKKETRWRQRFDNFEKSFQFLEEAISIEEPDMVQKAGLIQFFEISFELAWKVMKDFLEAQGLGDIKYPREVLKIAYEADLIQNGHAWLKALSDRNLTSHTYNETIANTVISDIRTIYYPLLKLLYDKFKSAY